MPPMATAAGSDPRSARSTNSTLLDAADELVELVRDGDIVYIHDPQPAGLIPHVKSAGTEIVWRCHVGVDHPNGRAREAWDFLRPYVDEADALVFSRKEFVWDGLESERLWLVPPSIDAFSPKNEELDPQAARSILNVIGLGEGDHFKQAVFERVGRQHGARRSRRRARPGGADPRGRSADRPGLPLGPAQGPGRSAPLFRGARRQPGGAPAPRRAVGDGGGGRSGGGRGAGGGSRALEQLPAEARGRVHLACLPLDDVQENAAMVNAIQRRADVVVQKSLAEGFGLTVAEAMWKSKPVVASRVGGIQDQIVDGESGVLVDDPADLAATGEAINRLLDDPERARRIGENARERVRRSFLGTRHLAQYMQLIEQMLRSDGQDGSQAAR